jgi:hypothetical protein
MLDRAASGRRASGESDISPQVRLCKTVRFLAGLKESHTHETAQGAAFNVVEVRSTTTGHARVHVQAMLVVNDFLTTQRTRVRFLRSNWQAETDSTCHCKERSQQAGGVFFFLSRKVHQKGKKEEGRRPKRENKEGV